MSGTVLALLLTLSHALADDPEYQRATDLYMDLECEQALTELQMLEARPSWTSSERAQLALWQALCFAQLAQDTARDAALARALREDRGVQAPAFAPPAIRSALEVLRARLPPPEVTPPTESSRDHLSGATAAQSTEAHALAEGERPSSASSASPPAMPPNTMRAFSLGSLVAGGLVALGGLVAAGLALPHAQAADDPDTYQVDAVGSANAANQYLAWSGGLLAGGGVLAAGGIALHLLAVGTEPPSVTE